MCMCVGVGVCVFRGCGVGVCVGGPESYGEWGHVSVQYHPYGDTLVLTKSKSSQSKMLKMICLVHPVKTASIGASLEQS